tara:strand:- start:691 stop:1002 length:312 start_codon:yes stop_codon:yes gene_type:complete
MTDELKFGDGLLAQIEKEGNMVTYKPIDLDNPEKVKELGRKWKEFCKKEAKRMKDYIPRQSAHLLLAYPDDMFKAAYLDGRVIWMGGIDVHNSIVERAKKLGL